MSTTPLCCNPDPSTVLPGDGAPRGCTLRTGHDGYHANTGNAWREDDAAETARAARLFDRAEYAAGRGWQAKRDRRAAPGRI